MANIIPAESSGFETAGSTGDWTAWYGCTIAQTTAEASEGTGSLAVDPSDTFAGVSPDGAYPGWPASPGSHTVSVDANTSLSISGSTWTVTVTWRQGTTDLASDTFTVSPGALSFNTGSTTSTAPANTDALWLTIESDGTADTTATYYFDVIVADSASTGQTVTIGQVSETDTANALSGAKTATIGRAVETDTAQPVTANLAGGQTVTIGQATETNTARAVRGAKARTVGQVVETDVARGVSVVRSVRIGQAAEIATAFGVTGHKTRQIGRAVETETALALIGFAGSFTIAENPQLSVTIANGSLTVTVGPTELDVHISQTTLEVGI